MMALLGFLSPFISKALDLIPDPEQRAKQYQEIMTALQQWDGQQAEVNKAEAQSSSVFVAGWRPAIGWTCALALFYQYLIVPFATWGCAAAGLIVPAFPALDDNLWQLMFGMLGMGGLRTFEKLKGATK